MRIRLTKFYRASPELDRFSDEECQRLLRLAKRRRGDAIWILPLGLAFVVGNVLSFVAWAILAIIVAAGSTQGSTTPPPISPAVQWLIISTGGFLGSIAAYVWCRRRLLLTSMVNNMERAKCPYCWFSLMGLPVRMGGVTCPECGAGMSLAELGLTPEDLRPPSAANPPPVSPLRRDVGKGAPVYATAPPEESERPRDADK
jgi:hypothetical protein